MHFTDSPRMNLLRSANVRQSWISNANELRSRRKSAAKKNSNAAKRLLANGKFNENESKLRAWRMLRRVLLDKPSKRGDLKWRRQSRLELHLQQSDPSRAVI